MREESTITKLTRTPFRADSKERSRSADAKIQQRASTSEGCPAASCCQRLLAESSATADLQVPNRKQRRASLSASTGDQKLPRAVRRPHTQLEMPERTHASATPRPADSIGSRRTVPIAPRRRRRSNPLAEAPPSRARGIDHHKVNADPFPSRFKGAVALGRCQNPTACEHIRRLPCGQLLPAAVGGELRHRRSPSPKQKTAASLAVGQHRRPEIAARRSAPAHPAGNARAHTRLSHPSASGFDRLAPNSPHSSAPAPPIESAGRGAALACARNRPSQS